MIAAWPGKIKEASVTSHISAFYDVLPTLGEIAGADIPDDTDGRSFLPVLLDKDATDTLGFYYWEYPEYGGQIAIRMGRWKGIIRDIKKNNMTFELYDLEIDISEDNDVAIEHPEIIERMNQIIKEQHTQSELVRFRMEQLGDSIN